MTTFEDSKQAIKYIVSTLNTQEGEELILDFEKNGFKHKKFDPEAFAAAVSMVLASHNNQLN